MPYSPRRSRSVQQWKSCGLRKGQNVVAAQRSILRQPPRRKSIPAEAWPWRVRIKSASRSNKAPRLLRRCRRGMRQLHTALRDGGGGSRGIAFARDLHGREGEFDAIGIERRFDHGKRLSPDDEILARQGHHLHPELDCEIAERVDALHL